MPGSALVFSLAQNKQVEIMIARIARILSVGLMVVLLAHVHPALCGGWSLPNPFSSQSKNVAKKKTPITKVAKKKTSVLDKIGLETKNFFDRAGETLGLKKPAPKKYGYARALGPRVQTHKKAESKSWLSPMFEPEEPKRPRNVTDWMGQPRQDL